MNELHTMRLFGLLLLFTIDVFLCLCLAGLGCKQRPRVQTVQVSPTQTVCRLIEQCWYKDMTHTTAVFTVMGDGSFSGERFDIWNSTNARILSAKFRGTVPPRLASNLAEAIQKDHRWTNLDGVATYQYGMMDYGKFDHPLALGEFLTSALPASLRNANTNRNDSSVR